MIVCTVGKIKSGKTEVAKMIREHTGFPLIEISSIVKQFAGSNVNRKELQLEKNKHKDPDWLYNRVKDQVVKARDCIVSGIREMHLLNRLREDFKPIIIIAAILDEEERKRRYILKSNKTEENFIEDDSRDSTLFDINDLIKEAHLVINTELPIEVTNKSISELAKFLNL